MTAGKDRQPFEQRPARLASRFAVPPQTAGRSSGNPRWEGVGKHAITVYVSENFDGVTVPALPTGWSASGGSGASIATESGISYSGAQALEFSTLGSNWAIAGKYGAVDSNYGNNTAECKFYAASVSGSIQTIGIALRCVQAPSGSTLPGSAYVFYGSMISGGAWVIAETNSSGTLSTVKSVTVSGAFAATTWYRIVPFIQEALDTSVYLTGFGIQRMSDGAWLYPSGSFGGNPDVATPFMSLVTPYTFSVPGTGTTYDSAWATGTFAAIVCKLASGEVMYVDDFIDQDVASPTGNVPASPSAAGNEVELIPSATSASDAGQTGHTGSNLNTADNNFSAYYWSANSYAGGFNQYALLDAGSGNTVIPTAMLWSPALGSDSNNLLGGLELFGVGMAVEASNSTSGPWTQLGVTPTNMYPRPNTLAALRFTLGATAYRYFRLVQHLMPCAINQFRMIVQTSSLGSANSRPTRPVISPAAGRFGAGATITASSTTGTVGGNSTVLYYLQGTRTSPPADPTNLTGTVLSGTYTLPSNAPDETVIKIVAYNAGCSTPLSAVTTGHFIVGTPQFSLAFDGTSGYVGVPNQSALQLAGACTIMCWAKFSAKPGGYTPFISKESAGGSNSSYYLGANNNGDIYAGFNAGGNEVDFAYPTSAGNPDGLWHHYALRYTGSGAVQLYIDGSHVATGPNSGNPNVNTSALNFGSYRQSGSLTYFAGSVADVAIFNSDIGATAINAIATGSAFPSAYSPVGSWHFNEGQGLTTADATANANTGTLNGGTTWSLSSPTQLAGEVTRPLGVIVPDTQVTGSTWFSNGSGINWPSDWYDTTGVLIYSNNDHCFLDPATGLYWLIGGNNATGELVNGSNLVYYRGHNWYSSSDLLNWTFRGQIICNYPAYVGAATGGPVADRMHVLVNPNPLSAANTYVIWANIGAQIGGYGGSWSCSSVNGTWKFGNYVQPGSAAVADCNVFLDTVDDGTGHSRGNAYFVFKKFSPNVCYIVQLDPTLDWLNVTGSNTAIATGGNNSWPSTFEAPVMFKYPYTGAGYYFIIMSKGTAYGAGNCTEQYASSTTLAGLNSATSVTIWQVSPGTATVAYNCQTTCLFQFGPTQLVSPGFILMFDQQDAGDTASPPAMINSRMAWFPVSTVASGNNINAFPSPGVLSLGSPPAWDLSYLPAFIQYWQPFLPLYIY